MTTVMLVEVQQSVYMCFFAVFVNSGNSILELCSKKAKIVRINGVLTSIQTGHIQNVRNITAVANLLC